MGDTGIQGEVHRGRSGLRQLLPILGPAFIASIAYVDPGNFATNIQAGSTYGYTLLWVIVGANLMAMVIQYLSAKLGVATGYNLAEMCRQQFPRPVVWIMWVLMEMVAMATDLAEFLGASIGFNLLLGIPLGPAAVLTAIVTLGLLGLQQRGYRPLELVITGMLAVIALCYVVETVLDQPDWLLAFHGALTPRFPDRESVLLGTGILGATVMPHVIFLHSALTQGRIRVTNPVQRARLCRLQLVDVVVAMSIAGMVNGAMLIMAAATFHRAELFQVSSIEEAYRTLEPLLGRAAPVVFALSLLASGLSSSTVGTMAGQVIMQGFLHRQIPLWVRRLVTIAPSMVVIWMGLDPTRSLVISQVALSFGIPFAVVPLVLFTSNRTIMGDLANRRWVTALAWLLAALVTLLNLNLIWGLLFPR